ncbi:hypothetical protein E8E13_007144 [Curvularia kusanoi]|uniref:Uncharacterized protein n=1 Tax=Curvularia kusanoi TaxID=90978 RepID=A0A9P4TBX7_CURKU|nr:hypothetical protein E8E13_007144 [Curvularia kusanoi]
MPKVDIAIAVYVWPSGGVELHRPALGRRRRVAVKLRRRGTQHGKAASRSASLAEALRVLCLCCKLIERESARLEGGARCAQEGDEGDAHDETETALVMKQQRTSSVWYPRECGVGGSVEGRREDEAALKLAPTLSSEDSLSTTTRTATRRDGCGGASPRLHESQWVSLEAARTPAEEGGAQIHVRDDSHDSQDGESMRPTHDKNVEDLESLIVQLQVQASS